MENGIVIPCYNEAQRLQLDAFQSFVDHQPEYRLCFVNDGSKDDTLAILRAFQNRNPRSVMVYDMPQNQGKAAAVRAGILHLVTSATVKTVGFMDADLSTSFEDYLGLTQELQSGSGLKKMVFGSRKMLEENTIERTLFRSVASKIIGLMIHSILRLPIHDTQCGAKVFAADLAKSCFRHNFVTKWLFDVELFIRAKRQYGRKNIMERIVEKPLADWKDVEGSKITFRDSVMIPSQLWKIFFTYDVRPTLAITPQKMGRWSHRLMTNFNLL